MHASACMWTYVCAADMRIAMMLTTQWYAHAAYECVHMHVMGHVACPRIAHMYVCAGDAMGVLVIRWCVHVPLCEDRCMWWLRTCICMRMCACICAWHMNECVCMFACTCIWRMNVCAYVCMCLMHMDGVWHMNVYVCMHVSTCTYIVSYTWMCTYVCMHVSTCTCMCIDLYVYNAFGSSTNTNLHRRRFINPCESWGLVSDHKLPLFDAAIIRKDSTQGASNGMLAWMSSDLKNPWYDQSDVRGMNVGLYRMTLVFVSRIKINMRDAFKSDSKLKARFEERSARTRGQKHARCAWTTEDNRKNKKEKKILIKLASNDGIVADSEENWGGPDFKRIGR
jgi:hypothetical protein